jgi:hypothetical protein
MCPIQRIILLAFLSVCFPLAAQKAIKLEPYEDAVLEGRVNFQLKENWRTALTQGGWQNLPWPYALRNLQGFEIEQRFPGIKPPGQTQSADGIRLADLSLFGVLHFDPSIPVDDALNLIRKSGMVRIAEPHFLPELMYVPNDDSVAVQYGLQKIQAFAAWDLYQGDTTMVIGITDTGIDPNHPDIGPSIARNYLDPINGLDDDADGFTDNFMGWDTGSEDNDPSSDGNFHGQHVSGLASATVDNDSGIAGSGFKCRFLPVKIANSNGSLSGAYEGLIYAAQHGCAVVNCSWGGRQYSVLNAEIVRYVAINLDRIIFCGAGNNYDNIAFYPSAYEFAFAVGSTDASDHKSDFSNFGYYLDAYAPGDLVLSTWANGDYIYSGGTSMASPLVAGAAGILRTAFPNENSRQITERLKTTADPIDGIPFNSTWQGQLGSGRINLFRALTETGIPAPVFHDAVISDTHENLFFPSDTIDISGWVTNYLFPANSVTLRCYSLDGYLEPLQESLDLGPMGTLENAAITSGTLRFRIAEGIAMNTQAVIRMEFESDGIFRNQYVYLSLNADFINIHHNDLATSIGASGLIGVSGNGFLNGLGFQFNGNADLLYESGLMVGWDDQHVADNIRGNTGNADDWSAIQRIEQGPPWEGSTLQYGGAFEGSTSAYPIRVLQRVLADSLPENRRFILLEYTLINTGNTPITGVHAGIFSDWDMINAGMNAAGFDPQTRCGYTFTVPIDSLYAGFALLTNQTAHFNAIDNVPGGNGGITTYDGFNDFEKYLSLSQDRWTTGAGLNGTDVIMVNSAGPFNLELGDSVRVCFALLAGQSAEALFQTANQAATFYTNTGIPLPLNEVSQTLQCLPNPGNGTYYLNHASPIQLQVMDMKGQMLQSVILQPSEPLHLSGLSDGLYLLKWTDVKQSGAIRLLHRN